MQKSDALRQKANALYCSDGYRLKVIIACLTVCLFSMVVDMVTSAIFVLAFPSVIETEQGITFVNAIIAAVVLVLVLPMTFGVYRMAFRRYRDEEIYVTNIFSVYKNLPRAWLVMLIGILPAGVAAAIAWYTIALWKTVSEFSLVKQRAWVGIPVYAAIIIMALCILALTALFWLRLILLPAYAFRGDMSLWRAVACSFRASRGRTKQLLGFLLPYIGWLLLDVLTLGVLLIIHTAPRFAADYTVLSDEVLHNTLN